MRALNQRECQALAKLIERRRRYIVKAAESLRLGDGKSAKLCADAATNVQAEIHEMLAPARKRRAL